MVNTDHPDGTAHRGVAIFVKSSITFQPLPPFRQGYLQSCAILLKLNNLTYTIAAIYAPQNITLLTPSSLNTLTQLWATSL